MSTEDLLTAFDEWSQECEEREYTDTGQAWYYLNALAGALRAPDEPEFIIAFEIREDDWRSDREWAAEDPTRDEPDWADYLTWHLTCPGCGAENCIVEVDSDERWNKIGDEFDFSGGKMFAVADLGDHGDYEFSHWLCTACLTHVSAPEFFQIEEYR